MVAYTYPLLNLFWTMLVLFAFVMWVYLLFVVIADIFRSHDMGGWAKAAWLVGVLILPLVGLLVYLIARGGRMAERSADEAYRRQQEFDAYVRRTAHTDGASPVDELAKLAALRDDGKVTDREYEQAKEKLLR